MEEHGRSVKSNTSRDDPVKDHWIFNTVWREDTNNIACEREERGGKWEWWMRVQPALTLLETIQPTESGSNLQIEVSRTQKERRESMHYLLDARGDLVIG